MSDYRETEPTEEAEKMLSVSVLIPTFISYQENSQEQDSGRGGGGAGYRMPHYSYRSEPYLCH